MKAIVSAAALICWSSFTVMAEDAAPAAASAPPAADSPAAAPAPIRVGPRWVSCTAEVQKFCAGKNEGRGWVKTCLGPHLAELSEPCKAVVGEAAASP